MSWGRRAPAVALFCLMAVTGLLLAAVSPVSAATTASPDPGTTNPCDSVFGGCTTSADLYSTGPCLLTAIVNWGDGTTTTVTLMDQSTTVYHTYDQPGDYTVSDTGSAVPTSSGANCVFNPFSFEADLEPAVDAGSKQTVIGTNILSLKGTASDAATSTTWSLVSGPQDATAKFAADSPDTTVTVSAPGNYTFELTATDANGDTATSQVTDNVLSYIALGDSYSSGPGAGQLTVGRAPGNASCYRSTGSYPEDIDTFVGQPNPVTPGTRNPAFIFGACAGASTTDFLQANSYKQQEIYLHQPAGTVGLVTITMGGVDAYFGQVMTYCAERNRKEPTCEAVWGTRVSNALAGLGAKLYAVYTQIKNEASLAPNAQLLVLGYPRIFPLGQTTACRTGYPFSFPFPEFLPADMSWMNRVTYRLDQIIYTEATAAGLPYVDPYNAFDGHERCQADPYVYGPTLPPAASFHPTVTGHAILAGLAESAISALPSPN